MTASPVAPAAETTEARTHAPHGLCDCRDGCQCALIPGPAAFEIERDGKAMKVCTRCTLSDDKNQRLLITKTEDASVYLNYDPLGAFVIALDMVGK